MGNQKPPFEITPAMVREIAEIAELVGRITAMAGASMNPKLRRENRIRTIQPSFRPSP